MGNERSDDWMPIFGGGKFWLKEPEPQDFDIGVIAHALSMICRFNGHVKTHYSVAQHSVLASEKCSNKEDALKMLFHDGGEAYTGDIITPLKKYLTNYEEIESNILIAMGKKFGFIWDGMKPEMKEIDKRLLATEVASLVPKKCQKNWSLHLKFQPYDMKIVPWSRKKSKDLFLKRYWELTNGKNIQGALYPSVD